MNYTNNSDKKIRFKNLDNNLITFQLNNQFISDNKFLFIAPQQDFCTTCFQRRHHSQIDGASIDKLNNSIITLAKRLDAGPREGKLWRWHLVEEQKVGKPFELIPYEDCLECGNQKPYSRDQARNRYNHLLNMRSTPILNDLKNQIFSFGFARGLITDNQIGSINPALKIIQGKLNKILGNHHHARIIFRMIAFDGRHSDETSTGLATERTIAVLKSIMEYLERYAFSLKTCSLKTKEYDDQIIRDYLTLYKNKISEAELNHIKKNAFWSINLGTNEICPIPVPFVFNEGHINLIQPTSNGFAAHINFKNSLCNSILELVERDAFVRFWHDPQRAYIFTPDKIAIAAIDNIIAALETTIKNECLVSTCYIVESPTKLPVVMATISSQDFSRPPSLCFGYGTGFDIPEALSGAINELKINASNLIKAISFYKGYLERKFTTKIESSPDRMNLYSTSAPRDKLQFLDNANPFVEGIVESLAPRTLDALIERCSGSMIDIYGIDFTPNCFLDKNVFVTRAFSPQLYPLQFQHEDGFNLHTSSIAAHKDLPHFFL